MIDVGSSLAVCGAVAVFVGCAAQGGSAAQGGATMSGVANSDPESAAEIGPVLHDVTPDSVPAGEAYPVTLVIRGEGFDPEQLRP